MNTFYTAKNNKNQAEKIRRQYIEREPDKLEELKKLDSRVKLPGTIIASVLGTLGVLVMGGGMSFVMVWSKMAPGLALGIPGMIAALLAYPVYKLITDNRKKKYANEILKLSSEITDK